ncbi:sporulation protein [Neobacillus notoginsengisoli]|uniref:Sporulation protein n=1 Tax=Neobacillus notoginsengisoli TaxID=1578198 RepID=A0A417YXZ2_9BACI|nr:YhcN/YlaJ family sporulation lipoprotein [Neobacillus notoginsengisoli]RHW42652.1 sporulation protein [Neobacillus notoginsengisoli]
MQMRLWAYILCGFLLAGCAGGDTAGDNYGGVSHLHPDNRRSEVYGGEKGQKRADKSQQFGFFRHQKSPIMGDRSARRHPPVMDRKKLARDIGRLSTDLPNVNDAAVLVTDDEVLVAYESDTDNRELTADQVRKTAISVVPSFYHVYVSDNKMLIRDVETLSSLNTQNENATETIDAVIREMRKSPQGFRPGKGSKGGMESGR